MMNTGNYITHLVDENPFSPTFNSQYNFVEYDPERCPIDNGPNYILNFGLVSNTNCYVNLFWDAWDAWDYNDDGSTRNGPSHFNISGTELSWNFSMAKNTFYFALMTIDDISTTNFVDSWFYSNMPNVSMSEMFEDCSNLTSLNVVNWNTASVVVMDEMFEDCYNLTNLDGIANWDVGNVINMHAMFVGCSNLTNLDVANWNTSKVTNMAWMFSDCESLTSLNMPNWDTANVTNMHAMFVDCSNLTNLDVANWDTASVIDMAAMFVDCSNLTNLDVANWDTGAVTNMANMFEDCYNLTSLDVANWNTASVTTMTNMFEGCSNLTGDIYIRGNNVTNTYYMFRNAGRNSNGFNVYAYEGTETWNHLSYSNTYLNYGNLIPITD